MRIRLACSAWRAAPPAGSGCTVRNTSATRSSLLRPGGAFGRLGQLPARQRRHGVDLAEQLVGGGFELGEVGAQRMLGIRLHVLDQKLAVAFDGVERRAQIVPQAAMEFFEGFVLAPIGRCILDQTFHECVQLHARAAHAVEIGEQAFGLRAARILDDHVEKIGDGGRRRLHLLPQERRQGAA